MASILKALSDCLTFSLPSGSYQATNADKTEVMAADVLTSLYNAEKEGAELNKILQDVVGTNGWSEILAQAVLRRLEEALNDGVPMGQAMKGAFDRAVKEAAQFSRDHPVFCTLLALGILAVLAPYLLEALGFAELGPVEGGELNPRH